MPESGAFMRPVRYSQREAVKELFLQLTKWLNQEDCQVKSGNITRLCINLRRRGSDDFTVAFQLIDMVRMVSSHYFT